MAQATRHAFLALCTLALGARAQSPATPSPFSGSIVLASQYVYRGLANSSGNPALQGGFKYSLPSGFHAGVYGSNSSWIPDGYAPGSSHPVEIDLDAGWKIAVTQDFSLDLGLLHYAFPGHAPVQGYASGTTDPATDEAYLGAAWHWVSAKYSRAWSDAFGTAASRGSDYLEVALAAPLGDGGITLTVHAGRQRFRGGNAALWPAASGCSNRCLSYTDYSLGVDKTWRGIDFGLTFAHANARARAFDGTPVYLNRFGDNIGGNHWIASLSKAL